MMKQMPFAMEDLAVQHNRECKGLKGLEDYDWSEMPKTRTNTEQK